MLLDTNISESSISNSAFEVIIGFSNLILNIFTFLSYSKVYLHNRAFLWVYYQKGNSFGNFKNIIYFL